MGLAIVTGGSRGIGAAIAERLAADGHDVVINCASSVDKAEAVAEKCRAHGVTAVPMQWDVSDLSLIHISPHAEILNAAKDVLAEAGWTLEVVEFTDYVQPNTALVDGDLDANYFQHIPYLNNFNEENNADLVSAIEMHYEPFGIYPGRTATLEELADGATIAVPNDGSNETRALLLLQDAGLITLADGIDPTSDATILDIVENPKNLTIQEIAAEQLPRSLEDVDLAVINGNYALQADLNANEDSLITENPEYAQVYVNTRCV